MKRMYNMYRRGLLSIDSFDLLTVKHIDCQSGIEYDAISVPKHLYAGLVQSIHIKFNHPSRNQLHKFLHRYFFCIGLVHTVDSIHSSCQVCTSLSALPLFDSPHTTSSFGSNFSADIMVSSNHKILFVEKFYHNLQRLKLLMMNLVNPSEMQFFLQ